MCIHPDQAVRHPVVGGPEPICGSCCSSTNWMVVQKMDWSGLVTSLSSSTITVGGWPGLGPMSPEALGWPVGHGRSMMFPHVLSSPHSQWRLQCGDLAEVQRVDPRACNMPQICCLQGHVVLVRYHWWRRSLGKVVPLLPGWGIHALGLPPKLSGLSVGGHRLESPPGDHVGEMSSKDRIASIINLPRQVKTRWAHQLG